MVEPTDGDDNSGVRACSASNARRFFPLPDYAIEGPPRRSASSTGARSMNAIRCVDDATHLSPDEAVLLDQIQKGRPLAAGQLQPCVGQRPMGAQPQAALIGPGGRGDGDGGGLINQKGPSAQGQAKTWCANCGPCRSLAPRSTNCCCPKFSWCGFRAQQGAKVCQRAAFGRWLGRAIRNIGKPTRGAPWALSEREHYSSQ